MPQIEDDWSDSDSDEEVLSDIETSVNLGLPDGSVQVESDLNDAAVSRIGGRPAFLPTDEPPLSCSECESCSSSMELLVQIYCPFEDSPMDRALYVWGCSKAGCQGKAGSVRAWRGLRYSEEYAKKLEKLAKKREREAKTTPNSTVNPFSMNPPTESMNLNALGAQIFDRSQDQTLETTTEDAEDESDDESVSSEDSMVIAMASTSLSESQWTSVPAHPPLYLSTSTEYVPAKAKVAPNISDGGADQDDVAKWVSETYENSLDVDQVFEKFLKRVEYEGEQCLRYDLGGIPLPFGSDSVFDKLFPTSAGKRTYTAAVPECPDCKGKRVFECQLMPNLINVLRMKDEPEMTEEERRKHVQKVLKGGEERGMTWGTCMVFSCKNDCCEGKEGFKEEVVLVQWDR